MTTRTRTDWTQAQTDTETETYFISAVYCTVLSSRRLSLESRVYSLQIFFYRNLLLYDSPAPHGRQVVQARPNTLAPFSDN